MDILTDAELAALSIAARNAYIDDYSRMVDDYTEWQARNDESLNNYDCE